MTHLYAASPNCDIYDEEFNRNLQLARTLIVKLTRRQDREICTKWITKLCNLKSCDPTVKRNRNQFFKYMLTVLHRGVNEAPEPHYGYPQYSSKTGAIGEDKSGKGFLSRWSADKRTYVAIKPLPKKGALVYMASTKHPELGWDNDKN